MTDKENQKDSYILREHQLGDMGYITYMRYMWLQPMDGESHLKPW